MNADFLEMIAPGNLPSNKRIFYRFMAYKHGRPVTLEEERGGGRKVVTLLRLMTKLIGLRRLHVPSLILGHLTHR
jgi:hypothetical protein